MNSIVGSPGQPRVRFASNASRHRKQPVELGQGKSGRRSGHPHPPGQGPRGGGRSSRGAHPFLRSVRTPAGRQAPCLSEPRSPARVSPRKVDGATAKGRPREKCEGVALPRGFASFFRTRVSHGCQLWEKHLKSNGSKPPRSATPSPGWRGASASMLVQAHPAGDHRCMSPANAWDRPSFATQLQSRDLSRPGLRAIALGLWHQAKRYAGNRSSPPQPLSFLPSRPSHQKPLKDRPSQFLSEERTRANRHAVHTLLPTCLV